MEPKPLKDILREALESGSYRTQEELAEALGISSSTLSNYMRGTEPRYTTTMRILDRLGLNPAKGMEERASPPTFVDLKACLTGLGLSDADVDFTMDIVEVRMGKRRRKGQGNAATG